MDCNDNKRIGLQEAIGALRSELSESILAGGDEKLRFEVGQIELEFQVAVERSATAKAGFTFWVIEAGGEGGLSSSTTHTVTVSLKPVFSTGGPVLTGLADDIVPD